MGLTVSTWFWGEKYSPDDVRKLAASVRRNLKQSHRFMVVTTVPGEFEDDEFIWTASITEFDRPLLEIKGCFARLRCFDPRWQSVFGVEPGERLACLDLDVVVTDGLDPVFDRSESFVILQGANASNPCPFNGSVMMLRGGTHSEVWSKFSLANAASVPYHQFPDDQGWLHYMLPNAAGWKAGGESGVYAFKKPGWPAGDDLPKDARLVVFPGWRDPSKFSHLSWVKENWRS